MDPRWQDSFPVRTFEFLAVSEAVHGLHPRRNARATTAGDGHRGIVLSRWFADRLCALQHGTRTEYVRGMEALSRGAREPHLDCQTLRLQHREAAQREVQRLDANVDRQQDLLPQ